MKAQIRSEMRKLLSIRTPLWLLAGVAAMSVVAVLSVSGQDAAEWAKVVPEQQFFFLGTMVKLLLLVLGIRIVTDEHRYGTIVPTFAANPRRAAVIGSKAIVAAAAGLVLALVANAVLLGTAFAVGAAKGHELSLGPTGGWVLVGPVVAGVLWTVAGVAVGTVVRSQVAAIVGSLVWVMGLEQILSARLGEIGDYLISSAGFAVALAPSVGAFLVGAATMAAWAIAGWAVGALVAARRDVV